MSLDKHLLNNPGWRETSFSFSGLLRSFSRKHDRLGEGLLLTEEPTGATSQVPWMSSAVIHTCQTLPSRGSAGVNAVLPTAASWLHVGMRLSCTPLPLLPIGRKHGCTSRDRAILPCSLIWNPGLLCRVITQFTCSFDAPMFLFLLTDEREHVPTSLEAGGLGNISEPSQPDIMEAREFLQMEK